MKIYYCIPTYKAFQACTEGIKAVNNGSLKPDQIIVIDNSGDGSGADYLYPLVTHYTNVSVWPQTRNLGVAASWNMFMESIDMDYVIIANDDIAVHRDSVEKMIKAATSSEDSLFTSLGLAGNAYSFFLLKQKAYKHIGRFDEKFYPAYYEDNDFDYRRRLLGYHFHLIDNLQLSHVGSATMKHYSPAEMEQHHNNFRKNQNYYISKWGGLPGQEIYKQPFDNEV